VLAEGIAEGQNFLDGNKRIALAVMLDFLEQNGYALAVPDDEVAVWMLYLSGGATNARWTSDILADHIRAHLIGVPM
jgi:prophage maintenance system killer protein